MKIITMQAKHDDLTWERRRLACVFQEYAGETPALPCQTEQKKMLDTYGGLKLKFTSVC